MKLRVKRLSILNFFLLLPLFKLGSFEYIAPWLDLLLDGILIVGFIYLLFLRIGVRRSFNDKVFNGLILFFAINLISTLINKGVTLSVAKVFIRMMYCFLYTSFVLLRDKDKVLFLLRMMEFLYALNLLCFITFPDGMYTMIGANGSFYSNKVWLFGGKNIYIAYIILTFFILKLVKENVCLTEKIIIYFFMTTNMFIVSRSGTGVLIYIALISYEVLNSERVKKKTYRSYWLVYILIIIFAFYMVVYSMDSQMMSLISNIINKDITFTGRTKIWQETIEYIKDKPWIGYGWQENSVVVSSIGQATAHDKYLSLVYRGGILSLILYGLFVLKAFTNLSMLKDTKIRNTYFFVLFLILIMFLVEVFDNNYFILMFLILCCNITDDMITEFA